VKELFEKEAPKQVKRSRKEMYAGIDQDYYGFRDEEDGVLLRVEAAAEKKMRAEVRHRGGGVSAGVWRGGGRETRGRTMGQVLPASYQELANPG
jgi:hypothetical protein